MDPLVIIILSCISMLMSLVAIGFGIATTLINRKTRRILQGTQPQVEEWERVDRPGHPVTIRRKEK